MLIDVFFNRFGRIDQKLRILDVATPILKGGGVFEAVTDSFVGDYLHIDNLFLYDVALAIDLVDTALGSIRDEYGQVAEIIKMMIYGLDAERTHAGDYH